MRRLAAAFSKRDKSQSPASSLPPLDTSPHIPKKQKSGLFSKSPKDADAVSPVPELLRPGLGTPSSSSSSESASLRTPSDDAPDLMPAAQSRKWPSWIPGRRKTLLPSDTSRPVQTSLSQMPVANAVDESDEDESDRYSSTSDDSSPFPASTSRNSARPNYHLAQANLRTFTQCGLDGIAPSHPLLNSLGATFPRSCNAFTTVSATPTMHSTLHRSQLLRRLDGQELSPSERASILPFSKRAGSPATRHVRRMDQEAVADRKRLAGYSRGLRTWLTRPAFEARMVEWKPADEGVVCSQVSGSNLAVAELEFSEGLQALAGSTQALGIASADDYGPFSHTATNVHASLPAALADASKANRPTIKFQLTGPPPRPRVSAATGPPDRQQHHHEEDDMPLGLVVQTHRDREERKRLALQEQQRQIAEDERRAREEQKQQKAFADEVLAARLRREDNRFGTARRGNPFDVDKKERSRERNSSNSYAPTPSPLHSTFSASGSQAEVKPRPPSISGSTRSRRTDTSRFSMARVPPSSSKTSLYASSAAGDSRQSLTDRRSVSESTSRARSHSDQQQRTLPRSFRQAVPPPLPPMTRSRSQPQVPGYPVYIVPAVPVVPMYYGADAGRHSIVDPRISWSTDRLSMLMPTMPTRAHIQ